MPLIETETLGQSTVIRFTNGEARNPLSSEVLGLLEAELDRIEQHTEIERLIFTGEGDVFASGANLREIGSLCNGEAPAFARRGQDLMARIEALRPPTIAAINGYCFGGALDLVLACDMRIASPSATFAHPGAGLGIITGWGGTQRLPRLLGTARALELFLSCRRITARDALRMGLVDEIISDLLERALSVR